MINKAAYLISYIVNPFLISLVTLFALTQNTADTAESFIKWMLLLILICVLPVYLAAVMFVRSGKMDSIFNNPREQRMPIYITGCICGIIALIALIWLDAPDEFLVLLIASILTAVLFLLINKRWKISVHTGSIAAFTTIMIILFGWVAAIIPLLLVALVGWSRLELKQHTIQQIITGALVPSAVITIVFMLFDFV